MRLLPVLLVLVIATCLQACATRGPEPDEFERLVAGSPLHAPNGLTLGPDGLLYAGSVGAQRIFSVDPQSGAVSLVVGPPGGEADDIAFGPDGQMVWTALVAGEIRTLNDAGEVTVLVPKQRLINPVAFTTDGRLFAGQMAIDRLYEFPPNAEPRLVAKKIGNLNSFEITADNRLFGPLIDNGEVAEVNIETGEVTVLAEDLGEVVAVNLDAGGRIWAIDWASGDLWRIDPEGSNWQAPVRVATLSPPLDNLAVGPNGNIFVSRPAHSAIDRVDPDTGEVSSLVPGEFAGPGGLDRVMHDGREQFVVADMHAWRFVDAETGAVTATVDLSTFGFPHATSNVVASDTHFTFTYNIGRSRVFRVDRLTGKTVNNWSGFKKPFGLVLLPDGNPVIADYATGTITAVSQTDRQMRAVLARGLDGPVGLAWADESTLYVSEHGAGRLSRVTLPGGNLIPMASGLNKPEGISVLDDGRVAVVEVGARRLLLVNPADNSVSVLAENLPVGLARDPAKEPVYLFSDVSQGSDGALYLTGDRDNSLLRIPLDE